MAFEVRHLWEWKILSSAKGCDGWLKLTSEWFSFFWSKATNLPTFENQFFIGESYETDSMLISDRQALWKHISMSAYLTFCQYSFKASSPSYWILSRRGETILEIILCAAFYIGCEKPIPSLLPIQYLSALFHLGNFLRKSSFINCTSTFRPEKVDPAKYRRLGSVGKSILLPFTWYWMRTFIEFSCLWIFAEKEKLNQSFEKVLMHEARLWASTKFRANILGENNLMKFSRRERATELVSGHLRGRAPCRRKSTSKQAELSLISWIFPHHSHPIVSRVAIPESFNQN